MVKNMKRNRFMLGIGFVCTVIISSICFSHITSISANRSVRILDGVTIVLDPGHGGNDGGAKSIDVKEKDINLKITEKLKDLLKRNGANVVMTREGDYDLADDSADSRKKADMKKRVELINEEKTDLFLSIHLNAYPNPSVKGAQAFYAVENEISKVFANIVQNHLKGLTDTRMTSKPGDYYILKNTEKIGVLVECGFLSNAEDKANLIEDNYQQKLAQTLYDSIVEYFQFLS